MQPGPTHVIACPYCQHLAKQATLASGNTIGARYWTDGKRVAPMLPEYPEIARCGGCDRFFWLADADQVGEIDSLGHVAAGVPSEWQAAEGIRELSSDAYLEAVETNMARAKEEEVYLRVRAWWAANDTLRDEPVDNASAGDPGFSEAMVDNLRQLDKLVDANDQEERLLKAEIARQLGYFAGAEALLAEPIGDEHLQPVAEFIRQLSQQEIRVVREIG